MKNSKLLFMSFLTLFGLLAHAQMEKHNDPELGEVIEVYLGDLCENPELFDELEHTRVKHLIDQNLHSMHFLISGNRFVSFITPFACDHIKQLMDKNLEPVLAKQTRKDKSPWQIRFHFSFSRTTYFPVDMNLESSRIDVVIKDFEFQERTSVDYYNPKNWNRFGEAFKWIDEPTNTFSLSFEKNKNILYLTAFHPKFLKKNYQIKHVRGTIDGVFVDDKIDVNEAFDGYNNQPGEMHLTRFENTHRQMDWQIGYGRRINLFDSKKWGSLNYIPRADLGITSGEHLTIYVKKDQYWDFDEYKDDHRIQGFNFSVGHRLEYTKSRASAFVEQKLTYSHLKHGFMDGTAEYDMLYMPISIGVGFRLYQYKKN